jgi:hypothetical protein
MTDPSYVEREFTRTVRFGVDALNPDNMPHVLAELEGLASDFHGEVLDWVIEMCGTSAS